MEIDNVDGGSKPFAEGQFVLQNTNCSILSLLELLVNAKKLYSPIEQEREQQ